MTQTTDILGMPSESSTDAPSTSAIGLYLNYSCQRAGWYNITVMQDGVFVVGPGPMSIQVLPDRPASLWSTAYAPVAMMLGTCADIFVRIRDKYGNGE